MASAPPSVRKIRRAAQRGQGGDRLWRSPLVRGLLVAAALAVVVLTVTVLRSAFTDPLERGRAALAAGDYRSARVDFIAVLADAPGDIATRIDLARALNRLERGVEAERQLVRARELGAGDAAVRIELARAQLVQDRAADALATLRGAVPVAEQAQAMIIAGKANYRLGRAGAAERAFALATAAGDAEAYVAAARWRLAEQDMLQAEDAATEAWRRAPRSPEALLVRADVVLARAGPVAALPWYEAALEAQPSHLGALIGHAAALGASGRATEMLVPLRRAADLEPNNPRILYLQAAIAARGGEPALARTLLNRIRGVEADRPGVLMLRAANELILDAPVAARNAAARLLELQPDNRAARRLLALALAREDNIRGVIEVIDPITTRADADPWSLLMLSRAFAGMDWQADIAQPLDRAGLLTRGDPAPLTGGDGSTVSSDPRAAIPAIRAQLAGGQAESALRLATVLADANPGVAQARMLVGDAALAMGDTGAAILHFRAAANLRFDEAAALRLVGALARSGDRSGAAEAIDAFMARWPENVAALRVAAAMAGEGGDWAAAEGLLDTALARTGPNDVLLLTQLARARIEQGDAEGAIDPARRAYRLLPANATVSGVYGRALALSGEGDGRDAADLLLKAVRLAPEDIVLRAWLADLG